MTTDDIFMRARIRETGLWSPFSHCFIGAMDSGRRTIIFGLYANGYENGFAYLVEVSAEQLLRIVSQYETSMAELSADQQKVALDIAAKRYLDTLERQIHDQKMLVKRSEIDATALEFDAKEAALESDRLALDGLREKTTQAIERAGADIAILEAKIAEEAISRNYVEVEILEKELSAKRAQMRVLEAGLRGLEIQMDIREAAMQNIELRAEKRRTQQQVNLVQGEILEARAVEMNASAEVLKTHTDNAMLDADIAELMNRVSRTELDAVSRGVDTALLDVDIAKANLDTAMVGVDIKELQAKIAREGARRTELQTDIAMVDVRVAELQLDADRVDVQLSEIAADVAMTDVRILQDELIEIDQRIAALRLETSRYEIPTKKQAQIDAIVKQIDILGAKILAAQEYQTIEADLHASRLSKENAEQTYRLAITALDRELAIHKAQTRIDANSKDVAIALEQKAYQSLEDAEQNRIPASQVNAALDGKSAAIDAAKTMATANIVNTMVHQVGAA